MTVAIIKRTSSLIFAGALAFAAIDAPANAQSAEASKVDFHNGALIYYEAECDSPHECTFAVVGCKDEAPLISFAMDQKEVSAWFARSNGRVLLKVGDGSIETVASEIGWATWMTTGGHPCSLSTRVRSFGDC